MEEKWDIDDVLNNNTSVFVVKNLSEDDLLCALSTVYQYIQQYSMLHGNEYDILFYAEPTDSPKNQFFIFTNLPYNIFLTYNPEFQLNE